MTKLLNEQVFQDLPEVSQQLLELISVIYSAAATTPICQSAVAAGITLANGVKPTHKMIKNELESLCLDGWLSIRARTKHRVINAIKAFGMT